MSQNVRALASHRGVPVLGTIPYDVTTVIQAMNEGKTVVEMAPESPVARAIAAVAGRLKVEMNNIIQGGNHP